MVGQLYRVYAEDPNRGFLPSIGRLTKYKVPKSEDTNSASMEMIQVREGDNHYFTILCFQSSALGPRIEILQ